MTVTRDVIYDLLPGYFAGELSADAKALVDEFFATDPEFARMAERFRKLFNERRVGTSDAPALHEKQLFERARSFRTTQDRRFGIAVAFTMGTLLVLFLGALIPRVPPEFTPFGFLRPLPAMLVTVFGTVAAVAWVGWFISRHRPPTTN